MKVSMFVTAVVVATALLPVYGKSADLRRVAVGAPSHVARNASPLLYDRLNSTERLLKRLSQRRSIMTAARPSVVPPIARYGTIRRVDFLIPGGVVNPYSNSPNGYVTGINKLGKISYSPYLGTLSDKEKVGPAYVINDNGTHILLSESVLTPLEGPGLNIAYIQANALNDVGGVAGEYYYLFFRPDGTGTNFIGNLGWLGGPATYPVSYYDGYDLGAVAYAINNNNIAAGVTGGTDPKHADQAAIFGKTFARRALLGLAQPACANPLYIASEATGINDAGEVVGYVQSVGSDTPCVSQQAVRFNMNGYAALLFPSQPPTGFRSVAEAINQGGDIVGYAGAGQIKAFLYKAACNCVTYIPRPVGENQGTAEAYAVNASDDVVGVYYDKVSNTSTAFLATRGRTYDINSLLPPNSGWTISTAVGINDAREIIGYGYYQDPVTKQPVAAAFAMKP